MPKGWRCVFFSFSGNQNNAMGEEWQDILLVMLPVKWQCFATSHELLPRKITPPSFTNMGVGEVSNDQKVEAKPSNKFPRYVVLGSCRGPCNIRSVPQVANAQAKVSTSLPKPLSMLKLEAPELRSAFNGLALGVALEAIEEPALVDPEVALEVWCCCID